MQRILLVTEGGTILLDDKIRVISSAKFTINREIEEFQQLKNGELTQEVRNLIEPYMNGLDSLIVLEEGLAEASRKLGIRIDNPEQDVTERVQNGKLNLMVKAGFTISIQETKELIRQFSIKLAETKLRSLSGRRDIQIVESIQALDEVDKSLNVLTSRVREWYGLHFPELSSIIDDPVIYSNIVTKIGLRSNITKDVLLKLDLEKNKIEAIQRASGESKGGEIEETDVQMIAGVADEVLRFIYLRQKIVKFVDQVMATIAPNLSSIAGSTIGARLIAKAGGLEKLAKLPTSTVQVLGAEKALFRAMKTGSKPPKHGIIFQHQAIHMAPRWQRGKISRALSGKVSIAARIDSFRGSREKSVDEMFSKRLDEIKNKYPNPPHESKRLSVELPKKMRKSGERRKKR